MSNLFRNIPSVNDLLDSPPLKSLMDQIHRNVVTSGVRNFLTNLRSSSPSPKDLQVPITDLAERIAQWIHLEQQPSLIPVINATGILLHTGLGRAPLPEVAVEAIQQTSSGYASVEVDVQSGQRSQRVAAVEGLLQELTGAEAAAIVNNNAGATFLTLAALAHGQEVIVSRGELVEIGGSFRLPDVMASSGAVLREVGTTNKTRIGDYEKAINEDTAALMRVHTSNYVVMGFTESASLDEMIALGKKRDLPVIDDIGSGAMVDLSKYGLPDEPLAADSIKAGSDVVLFSGDKLLGGPQCGIIVGKKEPIKKIAKHPMMRAFRVDKMTLAALAATLRLYQNPDTVESNVPLLMMLSTPVENLQNRAERLVMQLQEAGAVSATEAVSDHTFLGGGTVPTQQIPTYCVALTPKQGNANDFAARLRKSSPCVFGRVSQDRVLLDLRSVPVTHDAQLIEVVMGL